MERRQLMAHDEPIRGDIYIADLGSNFGTRPVLIVQNNKGNHYSDTTIVVPITSQKKKRMPTHIWIPSSSGLKKPGTALCEHIFTIPQYDLRKYVGSIAGTYDERELDRALKSSLALRK